MKKIKDGFIYDTDNAELIYESSIHHYSCWSEKHLYYLSNENNRLFKVEQQYEKVYNTSIAEFFETQGFKRIEGKKFLDSTDQERLLNELLSKGIDLTDKLLNKEESKVKKSNFEQATYLKARYEELKEKLEEIKKEMLEIKEKAKLELNWIMSDEVDE